MGLISSSKYLNYFLKFYECKQLFLAKCIPVVPRGVPPFNKCKLVFNSIQVICFNSKMSLNRQIPKQACQLWCVEHIFKRSKFRQRGQFPFIYHQIFKSAGLCKSSLNNSVGSLFFATILIWLCITGPHKGMQICRGKIDYRT